MTPEQALQETSKVLREQVEKLEELRRGLGAEDEFDWEPKNTDRYLYIDGHGYIRHDQKGVHLEDEQIRENDRIKIGNYYKTEEEAQRWAHIRKAVKRKMAVPKMDDRYWTVNTGQGGGVIWSNWEGTTNNRLRYALGMVFPTREAAEEWGKEFGDMFFREVR